MSDLPKDDVLKTSNRPYLHCGCGHSIHTHHRGTCDHPCCSGCTRFDQCDCKGHGEPTDTEAAE